MSHEILALGRHSSFVIHTNDTRTLVQPSRKIYSSFRVAIDIMLVLLLQGKGFRWLEAMVLGLIATIGLCFVIEIAFSQPGSASEVMIIARVRTVPII